MKKFISSTWVIFILGFISGMAFILIRADRSTNNVYYKLTNDYCIENIGNIKSGTLLQVNEGMSEGFTSYILYLNLSDGEEVVKYDSKEKDIIIPYWLRKNTDCMEYYNSPSRTQ